MAPILTEKINLNETFKSYVNVDDNLDILWRMDIGVSDIDRRCQRLTNREPCTVTSKEATLSLETLRKYVLKAMNEVRKIYLNHLIVRRNIIENNVLSLIINKQWYHINENR